MKYTITRTERLHLYLSLTTRIDYLKRINRGKMMDEEIKFLLKLLNKIETEGIDEDERL